MNIEEFNRDFPIGTSVLYYPVAGRSDNEETKIRSEPWALGHGDIVVMVEGRTGGVSIDHIIKRKQLAGK